MNDHDNNHIGRRAVLAGAAGLVAAAATGDAVAQQRASHDVIIVGGGSAGSVMANRLSADGSRRVLLLEAGKAYALDAFPDPVRKQDVIGGDAAHDWGYKSEPGSIGRSVPLPRGKVLGGSSAVNAGVAMRAPKSDHDRWAREHDLPHLAWDRALTAYRRLETAPFGDPQVHGRTGPFPIHQLSADETSVMQRAFVESAVAAGYPRVTDFNGRDPMGAGPYPMNNRMGVRLNTGMTYLDAAVRARPNLTIRGGVEIDSVLIERGRAVGVRTSSGETIRAGEIILSGGTYGSPAILMRSGVGPADDLRRFDIEVVADLPVGRTLYDHPFYFTSWAARPDQVGLPIPPVGAMLLAPSRRARPGELDLNISAVHYGEAATSPTGSIFVLAVAMTRPASIGSVKLRSRDPRAAPIIDSAFLRHTDDRERLIDGVEIARRIATMGPLAAMIHSEIVPGRVARSRREIEAALPKHLESYHHPTSTVPMGGSNARGAVVDAQGRVRGVKGLRVVDASILPDAPSVASGVATLMIAETIATMMGA